MTQSGCRVLQDDMAAIAARIDPSLNGYAKQAAEAVASVVRSRLANGASVDVEPTSDGYEVGIGDKHADFYIGFIEYGTAFQPAKPVVTPAAEAERDNYVRRANNLEDDIRP